MDVPGSMLITVLSEQNVPVLLPSEEASVINIRPIMVTGESEAETEQGTFPILTNRMKNPKKDNKNEKGVTT